MLSLREDIFKDYDENHFIKFLEKDCIVKKIHKINESDRKVFEYIKKNN